MSGEKDGVAVEMFDFTAIENTGDGCRTKHLTAVVLPATGLPPFDLRPRAIEYRLLGLVGIQGITFDPAGAPNPSDVATIEQFERLFFLTKHGSLVSPEDTGAECLEQERLIRRLFTPELMWALSQYPTRSVQSHYGWLALWAGDDHQPASARPEMLVDAMTIRAALLTAKDDTTTKAIVPSRRGGDPRQQAGRAASAVLGGFAGLFAGFVMFVLVVTSKFIILPPWLTAMSFFLSLAFGTVAGAYFGGVAANYIVERYKTTCQRKAETATDVGPSTVPNSPGQPRHDVIGPALRMVFGLWFTLGGLVFGGIGAWLRYDMCAEGTSVSPDAARWVVPLMFGGAGLLLGGIGLLTIVRLAWPGQHQPRKAESENTHDSN